MESINYVPYDRYSKKVKVISERLRDQPRTPMETAVYWTEYVARHKGAPHLRSAGLDLSLVAYHSIDVFAFIGAVILIVFYIIKLVLAFLFCKLCKGSSNKVKLN